MQAVILADRKGQELLPLCDENCPALLPLANRPVLQYCIEDLSHAGIDDILLVVADHAERIKDAIGDGTYWGVRIRYLSSRGEEPPEQLLERFGSLLKPPFVSLRGDIFRAPSCSEFLNRASAVQAPVISARFKGRNAGMCLISDRSASLSVLSWPLSPDDCTDTLMDLDVEHPALLDSLTDFHRAALRLLESPPPGIDLPGLQPQPGLFVDRLAKVNPRSHLSGRAMVGEHCSINSDAELCGPCIIGSDCLLESGVLVHNSVVLPGTYVGENLQVENAIVSGDKLIRIDRGVTMQVPDPTLLSEIDREFSGSMSHWPEFVAAAGLLLLSLPLWPLAFLLSIFQDQRQPLRRHTLVSNRFGIDIEGRHRLTVEAWRFSTRVPLLRNLPLLWLVLRGHLRLFGSTPLTPQLLYRPASVWDRRREIPAGGLLGPALLLLPTDAPEEEIRLTEVEFVNERSTTRLLGNLVRAVTLLFDARSWQPAQLNN
jgi:hypothetical protein